MYFMDILLLLLVEPARSLALARSSHGQDGAYAEVAAARLFRCPLRSRVEKKLAHLAGHIAGDGSLLRPCECLIHIGGLQYPKSAHVLLGLGVRSVGDEHLAVGLLSQRLCVGGRGNAAGELPGAGSNQFAVERVDLFHHRFGYGGRVEVVGEGVTNQILWHDFFSLVPVACFYDSLSVRSGTIAHSPFVL